MRVCVSVCVEERPFFVEDRPFLVEDRPFLVEDVPLLVQDRPLLIRTSIPFLIRRVLLLAFKSFLDRV